MLLHVHAVERGAVVEVQQARVEDRGDRAQRPRRAGARHDDQHVLGVAVRAVEGGGEARGGVLDQQLRIDARESQAA